ncbi:MAG: hypothetical protein QNJ98_05600 [Planctomycetota bacterium]|nr:hypothetical protein [Planctomycetota bacterium]
MKRTLYALLICVAAVAVALVVSLGFERAAVPSEVPRFLATAFGEAPDQIMGVLRGTQSPERVMELTKRYRHMLGNFVEIERETGRRRIGDKRLELDLDVKFEKTSAPVRIRLVNDPEGYLIDELSIDAPPEFEMPATLKSLRRISMQVIEGLAQQRPLELYDHFTDALRTETPRRVWRDDWDRRVEPYAVFDRVEAIGEPEELEKHVYAYGHRIVFEKGTIVLQERWRYQDVQWILEELTVEESL